MRKLWLFASIALGLVATLSSPASALARTARASTAFRPIKSYYLIAKGSTETSVTGRLIYSRVVVVGHRYVRVGGGLRGTVQLYWLDRTVNHYESVASTVSSTGGYFSLPATRGGDYYVTFRGSSAARSTTHYLEVFVDAFSVSDLSVTATRSPDGSAFVVASADMSAPVGVLTTATPAFGGFWVHGAGVQADPYQRPFTATYYTFVPNNGVYRFGFTVPQTSVDQTLALTAMLEPDGYYWPASAVTSFTVSALLGP